MSHDEYGLHLPTQVKCWYPIYWATGKERSGKVWSSCQFPRRRPLTMALMTKAVWHDKVQASNFPIMIGIGEFCASHSTVWIHEVGEVVQYVKNLFWLEGFLYARLRSPEVRHSDGGSAAWLNHNLAAFEFILLLLPTTTNTSEIMWHGTNLAMMVMMMMMMIYFSNARLRSSEVWHSDCVVHVYHTLCMMKKTFGKVITATMMKISSTICMMLSRPEVRQRCGTSCVGGLSSFSHIVSVSLWGESQFYYL